MSFPTKEKFTGAVAKQLLTEIKPKIYVRQLAKKIGVSYFTLYRFLNQDVEKTRMDEAKFTMLYNILKQAHATFAKSAEINSMKEKELSRKLLDSIN